MTTALELAAPHWNRPLATRRLYSANCDVVFDFQWGEFFKHNHPNFSGLQDLSLAIQRRASSLGRRAILLLTEVDDETFREIGDAETYIAVVGMSKFLSNTRDSDRSALFFLQVLAGDPRPGVEAEAGAIDHAIAVLDSESEESRARLVEALADHGGLPLLRSMLEVAATGLERDVTPEDIETLSRTFLEGSGPFLAKVALAARRTAAIGEFEDMLERSETEHEFQRWFQENPWVFGTRCVRILDARRIDVENIADYIVESLDGFADVIEIKRPRLSFWSATRDHGNLVPHTDLVKTITQAQNYQLALERQMDSIAMRRRLQEIPIAKPASLVIHGRSEGWGVEECGAQRILNAGMTSVRVLTYDQVLRRAKSMNGALPEGDRNVG